MGNYFRIAEPFGGCAAKYSFKKSIINEDRSKKEPAEIIRLIPPIQHIPVPATETKKSYSKNNQGIYKEIERPGAIAYCFHKAKIVSGE